ncbi:phosphatidate phosphatase LPIN1 isoform X2 [Paramisgurnus dabryanus]|uniref:phosphatidate phosphatase LPIN1 isoform X2 n=1 Tax=Paramisgurnus dabryanus TaxID=90735 RepID=UPI0031F45D26
MTPGETQTMNYVGQLAGQVFVQVKELYRGLNPATLSGCIDVIVVQQPDGSLICSPFHVRFGKMGVLRSREKVVDIEINGEPVNLHMKLGENGEAFFVKETVDDQEVIPSHLITSPIPSDDGVLMGCCAENEVMKKRRKRRRKFRVEGMRREESLEFSDIELVNMASININESEQLDENSEFENESLFTETKEKKNTDHALSDGELSHSPNVFRPDTPKSDSELLCKGQEEDSAMLWTWGELPQAAKSSFLSAKPNLLPAHPLSIPISDDTHFRVISENAAHDDDIRAPADSQSAQANEFEKQEVTLAACVMSEVEESGANIGRHPHIKTDSPSKRKDERSRHLGADGVYLDDITQLEPEAAALYFPKRSGSERSCGDSSSSHSVTVSQSACSSGADSGVDSYDLPSIAISLCGGLTENREITKEHFQQRSVSYQQFTENPSIIDHPNLVVKIDSKYYNWSTAAPIILAMQAFQKPLPKAAVERVVKEKMPRNRGRWWFSWRGRANSTKSDSVSVGLASTAGDDKNRRTEDSSSSDDDHLSANQTTKPVHTDPNLPTGGVAYKKTLRLTSEQLANLQLKVGPNDVIFSVTTQYQGTCRCEGTIYLWKWSDKIIISDIDGTITRSDKLGHILPTLGKDWTHQGIARLYHNVSQNGYKFLYCSARAIGMANMTRGYLHWVNERGTMLPEGPVLLSPSSLFSALHREVIEKRPEKFKVACLTDIKNLFYPNTEPFYAAFGNRDTDVFSYKEVGVPLNRIFTVNPKGELIQEHAKTNISSYVRLGEVVDHVFPLLKRRSSCDFPCSDSFSQFTYWREQLPLVDGQIESTDDTAE